MRFAIDVRTGHLLNMELARTLGPMPALDKLAAKYSAVPERLEPSAAKALGVGTDHEVIETGVSLAVPSTSHLVHWANRECKTRYPDFYNHLRGRSVWQKTK